MEPLFSFYRGKQEAQLSQRQLGIKSNIDSSQIGRIERGEQNTTLSTILTLANALGKTPDELLKFSFSKSKSQPST